MIMSRSIHTTFKNVRGLTKAELNEQYNDPDSDLSSLAKKTGIKRLVKSIRKLEKGNKNGL
jgi:hypothetical protein